MGEVSTIGLDIAKAVFQVVIPRRAFEFRSTWRARELWSKVGDGVDQEGGISWG